MLYLIAPDKFKGTLSAAEVSATIAETIRAIDPAAETMEVPIADGGEGTAAVIASQLRAERLTHPTVDPLGRSIEAEFFVQGSDAYLDMSAASGLWLVRAGEFNPLGSSTYGTGILLWHLAESGVQRIYLGLGGSATIDAGLGMAAALGYRFRNGFGQEVVPLPKNLLEVRRIEAPPWSRMPRVIGLADVTTRLLGLDGATHTFGRQKGLGEDQLADFDRALAHLVEQVRHSLGSDHSEAPGAGAAGGFGYGILTFLHGTLVGGFQVVAEKLNLPGKIAQADVVITGEGRLDSQTLKGKGPFGVASLARGHGKPVWAVAGSVEDSGELRAVFDRLVSLVGKDVSQEEAIANPVPFLRRRVRELIEGRA
jgi:glycerate kinase